VKVELDPAAADAYNAIPIPVAVRVDGILDWIEGHDPQRRHQPSHLGS
jgi:hypothetical protein